MATISIGVKISATPVAEISYRILWHPIRCSNWQKRGHGTNAKILMEFKKKNIFCPILLIWYRDINRELDIFFSSNFTFRKRLRKKIDTCILCMIQHLMISDEVHRYLPVYCYFLISSILIEFPCNLQINTYQGSNLFMSICTKSHPRKDL